MLNRYRLPWAKYKYYDLEGFIQGIGKEKSQNHEWNDEEDLIINTEDYNNIMKRKERWYKIKYEEHKKKREDSTYSPTWKMLLILEARMNVIFATYLNFDRIPLLHNRPRLDVVQLVQ